MQRSAFIRLLSVAGSAATAVMLAAPALPAAAAPSWSEPISENFTETLGNFCGVTGLTVTLDGSVQGWEGFKPSGGPGSAPYYQARLTQVLVFTGPNGAKTRYTSNVVEKDTRVTETAAATTIDVLVTGNATLYGPDGKAIARDPGQFRYRISIDNETGEETFAVLRDSTGRTDDMCAAHLAVLGE